MDKQKRINDLKAELKQLEAEQKKGKKVGVFKALGNSTKHVFKSLGSAGKKVLTNPAGQPNDIGELDRVIKSLPA